MLILWLVIHVCGVGCAVGPHPRFPNYSIGFANSTVEELNEVRADWEVGGHQYGTTVGVLVPAARGENGPAPDPIPPQVTVSWRTPDGQLHHQTVKVAERVKNITFFSGVIWLKITDQGVQVVPLTEEQMDRIGRSP